MGESTPNPIATVHSLLELDTADPQFLNTFDKNSTDFLNLPKHSLYPNSMTGSAAWVVTSSDLEEASLRHGLWNHQMDEVSWKATYPIGNFRGAPGSVSLLSSFPLDFWISFSLSRKPEEYPLSIMH